MLSDAATNRTSAPAYSWRALIALLLFATLVRGGVLLAWQDRLVADPDGYRELARNLAGRGELVADGRVAYRPPLYPLVLVATGAYDASQPLLAIRWHLIFGVLTVWETARLGAKLHLGRWSLMAGALVAVDPILLNQSALIMTETLATLLAVAALNALTSVCARPSVPRGLWCGSLLALCCLCRPTFLPFAALSPVAIFAMTSPTIALSLRHRLQVPATCLLAVLAVLSVWTVRNYRLLGKPVVGTTHGGYTLFLGNSDYFFEFLRTPAVNAKQERFNARWIRWRVGAELESAGLAPEDWLRYNVFITKPGDGRQAEIVADEALYAAAKEAIAEDPAGFFRACLYRVRRFWGLVPYEPADQPVLRYAIGVWYAALFALALLGLWQLGRTRRLWQTPWLFGLLLVGTFMAVHTVYWTDMRMRAPVTPVVCLAAAVGAAWLAGRRRSTASLEKATT